MQRRLSQLNEFLPFKIVYDKPVGLVLSYCPAKSYSDFKLFLNHFFDIFGQDRQEERTFVTGAKVFQANLKEIEF